MEPLTVAASTAGLVMKYLLPEIAHFGRKVLDGVETSASGEAVGVGRRLLQILLRKGGRTDGRGSEVAPMQAGIERRVLALASDPSQVRVAGQLEGMIEEILVSAPRVLAEITEVLRQASADTWSPGVRSVQAGGDMHGNVAMGDGSVAGNNNVTGDGNIIGGGNIVTNQPFRAG